MRAPAAATRGAPVYTCEACLDRKSSRHFACSPYTLTRSTICETCQREGAAPGDRRVQEVRRQRDRLVRAQSALMRRLKGAPGTPRQQAALAEMHRQASAMTKWLDATDFVSGKLG